MQTRRSSGISLASPLAAALTLLCALGAGLFPLTGTPGPEAAQLLSLVGGPALLIAGAARGAARLERGFTGDLLVQGLLGAIVFFGFMAITTVSGWNHESCAPGRGYMPFFSMALPVLVLNSAIGLWIGRLLGHARAAVITAAALLAAYVLWLLLDWYFDPGFRVLSHLLVLVEGDMLRGRDLSPAGWAYRSATALAGLALCFAGASRFPRARRGGLSASPSSNPGFLLSAGVMLALAAVIHWMSVSEIAPGRHELDEAYSLELRRGSLVVRANPEDVTVRDAEALLAEGALWLERLKVRLGIEPEEEITIWLHEDSPTLGYWTGADHVHFALPMHNELHVADPSVPHPSLGHELVHVLGGQLSETVLGVPSRFGLLVNSGLVEGLAMAMTPELEVSAGLTLREKAAAMRRAELAPPALDLFGEYSSMFSFWRHPPGRAYVTAGAVVEALAAAKGPEGVAVVYREGDLEAAFESSEEMEAFLAQLASDLDAMPLSEDAVANVARVYARPSILDETCDKALLEKASEIRAAARSGDWEKAERLAREVENPMSGATLTSLANQAQVMDQPERAADYRVQAASAVDTDDPIEKGLRLAAAGDALYKTGERREAIVLWERIQADQLPPYPRRLVLAKRMLANAIRGAGGELPLAEASLALILQDADTSDDATRLARLADALARHGDASPPSITAFARYLLSRQYVQRGDLDAGLVVLLRLVEEGPTLEPPFDDEVLRALAMAHARRGDLAIAKAGFEHVASGASRPAVRILMRDRAERAARMIEAKRQEAATKSDRFLLGTDQAGGL